jgi:choline kinase
MKAIILAAGVGQRLGNHAAGRPKCLLELGGVSLLRRHLYHLRDSTVTEVIIVTGYRQETILSELMGFDAGFTIQTRFNPNFINGSIVSLWHARDALCSGDDIILMDADVLYDKAVIQKLITTDLPNCFLLDREFEPGDEPVKLCVLDGRLVEFRKHLDRELVFDMQGESVGFFRFSSLMASRLAHRTQEYMDQHRRDAAYEEAIRDLLLDEPGMFGYEDITGLPWIEIDFPEDIRRAETEILTNIKIDIH